MIQHLKWQRSLNCLIEEADLDLRSHFRTHINHDRFELGSKEYNDEAEKWISHTKRMTVLSKKMNDQMKGICFFEFTGSMSYDEIIERCEKYNLELHSRHKSKNNIMNEEVFTENDIVNCETDNTVNNVLSKVVRTEVDIVNCEKNTVNNVPTMEVPTVVDIVNCEMNTVNNESIIEDSFSSHPPQEDTVSLLVRPLKKSRVQETPCSFPDRFITIKQIDGRVSFKTKARKSRERKKRRDDSILLLHRLNDSFLIRSDFAIKTSGFKVQVFNTFNNRITDGAVYVLGSVDDFKWKILFNTAKMYIYTDSTTFYEIYDCYSSQKYYHLNLSISACT